MIPTSRVASSSGKLCVRRGSEQYSWTALVHCPTGCLLQRGDDLAADDDTIGEVGNGDEVLSRADSKADGRGFIAAVLLDPGQKLGQVGIQRAESTSDTLARDDVDERIGELAEDAHARVRRRGRNEGYVGESVRREVSQLPRIGATRADLTLPWCRIRGTRQPPREEGLPR